MTLVERITRPKHTDRASVSLAKFYQCTIRSRQGYRYTVTAVGRWHFLATHADDDEQTEFIFAIEGWRERFEVEG